MLGGGPFREAEDGQRLEEREQRAAKQPCLLAGDDRDGLGIAQPLRRGQGIGRCRPRALLRQDEVGDRVTLARMALRARNGVAPCRSVRRVTGKEVRDARMLKRVVTGEAPDPREDAESRSESGWLCWRDAVWGGTRLLLSQSVARSVKATCYDPGRVVCDPAKQH